MTTPSPSRPKRKPLPRLPPLHSLDPLGPIDLGPAERPTLPHAQFDIEIRHKHWKMLDISMNDRTMNLHSNARTQFWKAAAAEAAAGIDPLDWARVIVWFRFPDNIRRDTSNRQPIVKAIVDGLVVAGVVPDDRDEFVGGQDARRLYPNGPHRVVVQVLKSV